MKAKAYPSRVMNPICEEAGCDSDTANRHAWKWENKRWHSHPSKQFSAWWDPFEFDPVCGASVGGHPDARRRWARKDTDGWIHRMYGVQLLDAWNSDNYISEFEAWRGIGSPEPDKPFVSLAASVQRQKQFWGELKLRIAKIGKPMPPHPLPFDYDKPQKREVRLLTR